ncbi:MAG: 3,4-dihydroxy-2-butanone-4-phosphate synthase [Alphaproteobacteria bacterium]
MNNILKMLKPGSATSPFASTEEIIADIRAGKPVVIVDDENRENEGDIVIAAQFATPAAINFMIQECGGFVCLPMEGAMVDQIGLPLQPRQNVTDNQARFTVSIEAKEGVHTGVSAEDRAKTIQTAINPAARPGDISTPGHVFPLRSKDGGVLVRAGHTEAAVDLARLAGLRPAGVICEIMNKNGSMARLPDLIPFAEKHRLKIGTIADLIAYRRRTESLVQKIYESDFTSAYGGEFKFNLYASKVQYAEHIALTKGNIKQNQGDSGEPVLVRMHAVDFIGDILGGNSNPVLKRSMEIIGKEGRGIIVILRDADPKNLSQRLSVQKDGKQGTLKDYGIGAQILIDQGVRDMTLLTDHPRAIVGLEGYGLSIAGHRKLSGEQP